MEDTGELERKIRERASLFEEATRIVRIAEAQSKALTVEEDARVLALMARVRSLEEQIGRLKRHEHNRDPMQKGTRTNQENPLS
ncbi:MAG TPA: hypothetical protein VK752_11100 [Bryobacteraceae bacterium]|jgi:hypothetical protein|nr:hypothetical protein [Bryobacteraceae bacterium]